ncbi:tyrosine- phosphatase non-receptor type 22 isoform X1 [Pelobates cultripes]|uniref:protein-tyrosine-phosphatase n=1 Tax=Pelobates cultripes TaxID=61616 RepID=A0AAD1QYH1_PELCU|nr:tyrosine- phosphatase non-receptor type 22 isoform X1 [Pelobates cultripes]
MDQREVLLRYIQGFQKKKEKPDDFASDFMNLKRQSAKHKTDHNYSTKTAEQPENFKKNRYKDILPYRYASLLMGIKLSSESAKCIVTNRSLGDPVYVRGNFTPPCCYTLQEPPFWLLSYANTSWARVIVMACMEFEMGKKKCERYWVEVGSEMLKFGPFSIQCSDDKKKTDYVIRTLLVTFQKEIRIVYQFHYKNWPDHDVPSSVEHILDLMTEIRLIQQDDSPPICIHCSAGCGRTGVLCAIDYTWRLLKDKIIPMNFSIFGIIQEMRTQRSSLVQTKEQYELVYNAVIQLFKKELERLDDAHIYAQQEVQRAHLPKSSQIVPSNNRTSPSYIFADKERVSQPLCDNAVQEDIFQFTSEFSNPIIKSNNGLETVSPSSTETCRTINQPSNSVRLLDDGLHPLPRIGSCKPQITHSRPLTSNELQSKSKAEDRKRYSSHMPLLRTKSTPFELLQHRHSLIPQQATEMSYVDSHLSKNSMSHFSENSHLWQNSGPATTGSLGNISTVPYIQAYVRLTEDPYFSPSPSSDLGSPKFAGFCVEATYHDATKQALDNKLSKELPPLCSPTIIINSGQEMGSGSELSATTCKERSSNTDEEDPPPLPERTPESFIVTNEPALESPLMIPPKPELLSSGKIGTSLEWGGVSQNKVDDFKLMMRSKSVKVRSFRMEKTCDESPSPPPIPERTEESFIIASEASELRSCISSTPSPSHAMDTESSELLAPPEPEKQFTRKKSLRLLRNAKTNTCTSAKSSEAPQASKILSFLHFGFGKRFAKPKGPRNPPATWNL